jgi:MFS family permease
MLNFGQFWLVFELTESPLYLGYVGAANATSAITLNLFGGVYADKLDKRRLIIITQLITAALIFLLAFLTVTGVVAVWHILAIAFVTGAVNAFDQPARQALYPHLIERSAMVSAVALNSAIWQGTRIFAPAVAGVIIASLGTSSTFFIAGAGFAIMSMVIFWLHVPYIETSTGNALKNMADGLKFIKSDSVFWFLIGMTFFNSFFGMAYISMMPAITVDVLNLGADSQGTLMSIGGIGAFSMTMLLGSKTNFRHKGLLIIGGGAVFGLSVAGFAITAHYFSSFPIAAGFMIVMGMSSSIYMISIMSSLQLLVPDHMRGRVMGFYGMTWSIMPLSATQAGAVASFTSVPFAIAIGGFLVASFALGPALVNKKVRNVGTLLMQAEQALETRSQTENRNQPALASRDD